MLDIYFAFKGYDDWRLFDTAIFDTATAATKNGKNTMETTPKRRTTIGFLALLTAEATRDNNIAPSLPRF